MHVGISHLIPDSLLFNSGGASVSFKEVIRQTAGLPLDKSLARIKWLGADESGSVTVDIPVLDGADFDGVDLAQWYVKLLGAKRVSDLTATGTRDWLATAGYYVRRLISIFSGEAVGDPMLAVGNRGPDVARLQELLNFLGDYQLKVDGIFGAKTAAAAADAYSQLELGSAAPFDLELLISYDPALRVSPTVILIPGSTGQAVTDLQGFLRDQGFDIAVDGIFGDQTAVAVASWRAANGMLSRPFWSPEFYKIAKDPEASRPSADFNIPAADFPFDAFVPMAQAVVAAPLSFPYSTILEVLPAYVHLEEWDARVEAGVPVFPQMSAAARQAIPTWIDFAGAAGLFAQEKPSANLAAFAGEYASDADRLAAAKSVFETRTAKLETARDRASEIKEAMSKAAAAAGVPSHDPVARAQTVRDQLQAAADRTSNPVVVNSPQPAAPDKEVSLMDDKKHRPDYFPPVFATVRPDGRKEIVSHEGDPQSGTEWAIAAEQWFSKQLPQTMTVTEMRSRLKASAVLTANLGTALRAAEETFAALDKSFARNPASSVGLYLTTASALLRPFLLATAWHESALAVDALGDYKAGVPMSVGFFQLYAPTRNSLKAAYPAQLSGVPLDTAGLAKDPTSQGKLAGALLFDLAKVAASQYPMTDGALDSFLKTTWTGGTGVMMQALGLTDQTSRALFALSCCWNMGGSTSGFLAADAAGVPWRPVEMLARTATAAMLIGDLGISRAAISV